MRDEAMMGNYAAGIRILIVTLKQSRFDKHHNSVLSRAALGIGIFDEDNNRHGKNLTR